MPPNDPKVLNSRSGVVTHGDKIVALEHALERVPPTDRVAVMIEHKLTGASSRTDWNRLAVCVTLRKGSERYGIFETVGRARREGFGIVTKHSINDNLFVFIDTRPASEEVSRG